MRPLNISMSVHLHNRTHTHTHTHTLGAVYCGEGGRTCGESGVHQSLCSFLIRHTTVNAPIPAAPISVHSCAVYIVENVTLAEVLRYIFRMSWSVYGCECQTPLEMGDRVHLVDSNPGPFSTSSPLRTPSMIIHINGFGMLPCVCLGVKHYTPITLLLPLPLFPFPNPGS